VTLNVSLRDNNKICEFVVNSLYITREKTASRVITPTAFVLYISVVTVTERRPRDYDVIVTS